MERKNVTFLTHAAMIAAIYVVLTVVFQPFSFGEVQVRISEMLTILPIFTPAAIPGLFVGFLIGNESKGLSDKTADLADAYVRIPMCGQVESLNAAVASAILMYEANRQRRAK